MSILIKGKMPKDGECVVVFPGGVVQKYKAGGIAFYEYQDRTEEAVAVQLPSHGRLIDADALKETIDYYIREAGWSAEINETLKWTKEFIDAENTIIPADGGAEG